MSATFRDVRWYNGHSCVGIVYAHDEYDGPKFYIGVGIGLDEDADVRHILAWGAKFDHYLGCQMFGVEDDSDE